MKLSAVLMAVVAAQEGDDRWSFYDYSMPADGKVLRFVVMTSDGINFFIFRLVMPYQASVLLVLVVMRVIDDIATPP